MTDLRRTTTTSRGRLMGSTAIAASESDRVGEESGYGFDVDDNDYGSDACLASMAEGGREVRLEGARREAGLRKLLRPAAMLRFFRELVAQGLQAR